MRRAVLAHTTVKTPEDKGLQIFAHRVSMVPRSRRCVLAITRPWGAVKEAQSIEFSRMADQLRERSTIPWKPPRSLPISTRQAERKRRTFFESGKRTL